VGATTQSPHQPTLHKRQPTSALVWRSLHGGQRKKSSTALIEIDGSESTGRLVAVRTECQFPAGVRQRGERTREYYTDRSAEARAIRRLFIALIGPLCDAPATIADVDAADSAAAAVSVARMLATCRPRAHLFIRR